MSIKNTITRIHLIRLGINLLSNKSLLCCGEDEETNITSERNTTYHAALVEKWTPRYYGEIQENTALTNSIVILFYSLIIAVSLFGNLIVCKIVFGNSNTKSITNLYIGNLSVSDLMMTVINIPLRLTEVLSRNWPLGLMLCKCLPFFGAMSVSVSTLTMSFIALDRYQVIAHPLKPRPSFRTAVHKVILIWIMAVILSFPYFLMSDITNNLSYDYITRCTICYPHPTIKYRQIFTLISLALQFAGPLTISAITYIRICLIISKRRSIGAVTLDQREQRREAKWKTIKMLIIVLVVFVICWLPLNIYHTYQDTMGETDFKKHNSTIWFVCHWFGMSSTCCNPFIYCCLNDKFRKNAANYLRWFLTIGRLKSETSQKRHFLIRYNTMRSPIPMNTSTSLKFSSISTQSREDPHLVLGKQLSLKTTTEEEDSKQCFIRLSKTVVVTMEKTSLSVEKQLSNQKHFNNTQKQLQENLDFQVSKVESFV